MYFSKMHQERSYILALENANPIDGMWIGADAHSYSLRRWRDTLLFGGESHRTEKTGQGGRYHAVAPKGSRAVSGQPGDSGLVRSGLYDAGPYSLYQLLFFKPAGLADRHWLSKVGDDYRDWLPHKSCVTGFALRKIPMRISFAQIASPLKASPVWPKRESRRFRGWESAFSKFRKIQLKPFRQGMAESFGKMVKKLEY